MSNSDGVVNLSMMDDMVGATVKDAVFGSVPGSDIVADSSIVYANSQVNSAVNQTKTHIWAKYVNQTIKIDKLETKVKTLEAQITTIN